MYPSSLDYSGVQEESCYPGFGFLHVNISAETILILYERAILSSAMLRTVASFPNSWKTLRHDKNRCLSLFRGLARIILSLNKSLLQRISSFTLDHRGVITLTNRHLTLQLQSLENEGIPSGIGRNSTYSAVDSYILDLLMYPDNRIHHQPNSIHDQDDGHQQLAALTMMRAILPHFTRRDYRHGPFVFTLTDPHQSNIFVDNR
jgi:hypothetical protein